LDKRKGSYHELLGELQALANPERAAFLQGFFKTGPGEYAEGDRFLGIAVPVQRRTALRHVDLPLKEVGRLMQAPLHEVRFCALEILVWQYEHGDRAKQEEIFHFYLEHAERASNWDLVDTSAPYIVGAHLAGADQTVLDQLAVSDNLWRRRIAVVATLGLIKRGDLGSAFRISKLLLRDRESLIHKAVGWVLREAGKVSEPELLSFLRGNYPAMPRTALRYAIERFPPERRKRMLTGDFD
jgi:3-methyladenine DNA glycosylase AlkD